MTNDEHAPMKVVRTVPCAERALTDSDPRTEDCADHNAAADLLEAALFGSEDLIDQATVDLSVELPLIEGYKLLRLLGEGGFGMVYEADQRVPIKRRVALKVLRPGCTTRELLARFEQERQMLAVLNHPHIARIFDAGETEDGRPFIAMELVKGSTIDRHCQKLAQREKISLMRDVCRAVAHAHHKGIIHRDLKPSNILITRPDEGPPEPRVIDFGIAKALDGPMVTKVMFTQMRQVVGTPGYMSPERQHTSQISHSADTRTDVFALGAILWELLTGKTPEQRPEGIETHVTLPTTKGVSSELRWITEKATETDMERRYANADGLADDLDAWLDGLPLKAGPRSAWYVFSKWAGRNRTATAALVTMVLTLIASVLLLMQKNHQITASLQKAALSHAETQLRAANESYANGMSRSRRRPVLALANWTQALRHDPTNQAALGMALSTLKHRSFPRPIAPAAALPIGKVRHLALSADGAWAAAIIESGAGETLLRLRQGSTQVESYPIPADGRMTLIAVSKDGLVAVAAPRGPVGLLQKDGTWKASERELEALRHIAWTPQGQLWMVGIREVSRCDDQGHEVIPGVRLADREVRSAFSADGTKLAVGITGGRIVIFTPNGKAPSTVTPPIPAPLSALAISEKGEHVAAAWRSGDVWMQLLNGTTSSLRAEESVLHLHFMPDQESLLVHCPASLIHWNPSESAPGRILPLAEPLKTVLPLENAYTLTQSNYGRPTLQDMSPKGESDALPGFEGQVQCAATPKGDLILVADEEQRVIEWLSPGGKAEIIQQVPVVEDWLSLQPQKESHTWLGIHAGGEVCSLSPGGAAKPIWRAAEGPLRLAALSTDGSVVVFDHPQSPSVFLTRRGESHKIQPWGKPSSITLSPDGKRAALGYPAGDVRVFDTTTSQLIMQRDWQRGPINAIRFIDADRVAVAAASQVRVWEWEKNTVLPTPIDLSGDLTALAPCSQGRRLAAAGDDGTLHVIDVQSGRRIVGQLTGPVRSIALAWESNDTRLWAFDGEGTAQTLTMPPALDQAPAWLPEWIEQHIGMRIDADGRAERLHARELMPIPGDATSALKAWLERGLSKPQRTDSR